METVILLFLLFSMHDPAMRETLNSFLSFYRENRDLIAAFLQNGAPMSANSAESAQNKEESRPREEVGDFRILEEYLSRLK